MVVEFVLLKIIEIPKDVEDEFNDELITEDTEKIITAQYFILSISLLITITFITQLF